MAPMPRPSVGTFPARAVASLLAFVLLLVSLSSSLAAQTRPAAGKAPAAPKLPKPGAAVSILFVGNSYTQFHDLPAMVRALGRAQQPERTVTTVAITPGGCTLQQHWDATGADAPRTHLQDRRFDYVVLQEQSRRPLDEPQRLHEYAAKFAALVVEKKAVPVWYMTWARANEPEAQDRLSAAYGKAQQDGGGLLAPVGRAWQQLLAEAPPLPLHEADGSHPNVRGTYVAACVLYATMCGGDVAKFPDRLVERGEDGKERVLVELPAAEGKRLRAAAVAALRAPLPEVAPKPAAPAAPAKPKAGAGGR